MRNFSLIGLLIVVAIIGYWAKSTLAPSVSHDPNDKTSVEYWVTHESDRQTMLSYCNAHPDQQNTQDCKLAIAAQTQVDTQPQAGQNAGQSGVDQETGQAQDELEAQKDANNLP
ncbi:MAG TPA: hypothetical protein VEJ41_01470 [Candidatus Acidoferrales bacterium]|nr:hypothetical protein [Candidatus Acidoferrales bacterium]